MLRMMSVRIRKRKERKTKWSRTQGWQSRWTHRCITVSSSNKQGFLLAELETLVVKLERFFEFSFPTKDDKQEVLVSTCACLQPSLIAGRLDWGPDSVKIFSVHSSVINQSNFFFFFFMPRIHSIITSTILISLDTSIKNKPKLSLNTSLDTHQQHSHIPISIFYLSCSIFLILSIILNFLLSSISSSFD